MQRFLIIIWCVLYAASLTAEEPSVSQDGDVLRVELGDGRSLQFVLQDGFLLGLNRARVGDADLSSAATVQRPLIAQEYGKPAIWPFLKFTGHRVLDGKVYLDCELLGGDVETLWRSEFVFAGNRKKALGEGITDELRALQPKAQAGEQALTAAADQQASVTELLAKLKKQQDKELAKAKGKPITKKSKSIKRIEGEIAKARRALFPSLAKDDAALARAWTDMQAFEAALDERALEVGHIHRDYYAFAHLRLPSETCALDSLRERVASQTTGLTTGGKLTWIIEPVERVVAGWPWLGWQHSFRIDLIDGHQVNNVRQIGTWELGGDAVDLHVVNFRYRGIGGVDQRFTAHPDGGVAECFTTTEIMPHAIGGGPLVSPVIPPRHSKDVSDRAYALQHRVSAWISKLGRGSGVDFIDFQQRGRHCFASFYAEQKSLRACTEIFPGDSQLSQTDEQWFGNRSSLTTLPQIYLVLSDTEPMPLHEMRTRWQELSDDVRRQVADALGFKTVDPLPGVGFLLENGRAGFFKALAKGGLAKWHELGVRQLTTHAPGWWTDQHRNGPDKPQTPGNSNRVWDWVPTDEVKEPWQAMTKERARLDIPYFIYMTGMSQPEGPFVKEIGVDPRNWGMNVPGNDRSHGYPPLVGHNLWNPQMKYALWKRLVALQKDYGYDGFWADSFQNMYMSQLAWGDGSGAPMQEQWWQMIAQLSQEGLHWMSESHAFPGLSCSIEVSGWEDYPWYFAYTWKWLRGQAQNKYTPEQLDEISFRFMANRCWVAPDRSYKPTTTDLVIPSFTRHSAEYMAALPSMRRKWVLDAERGILWLPRPDATTGVWFAYADAPVPSGVSARSVTGGEAVTEAKARHSYAVEGEALVQSFGMRPAPEKDQTEYAPYESPTWRFPAWSKPAAD